MTGKLKHWVVKFDMPGFTKGAKVDDLCNGFIRPQDYPEVFEPVYELTSNRVEFPDSLPDEKTVVERIKNIEDYLEGMNAYRPDKKYNFKP